MAVKRREKNKVELIEKLVHVNRVTKVVKGGRRFSFAALVVVGNGKGKVGFGSAKAKEVSDAVIKATQAARKSMFRVYLKEGRTLHYDLTYKFGAGRIIMRTANPGTGVIAGGAMRAICEALGVQDVVAKSVGSTNPHTLVRTVVYALSNMVSPKTIALKRGKKMSEIIDQRNLANKTMIDVVSEVAAEENVVADKEQENVGDK